MKATFFLMSLIVLSSCSLFQSKETRLCDNVWILRVKVTSDIRHESYGNRTETFELNDSAMCFIFSKDGFVKTKDDHGWSFKQWEFRDKDIIQISGYDGSNFYRISTLNKETLSMTSQDDAMEINTLRFANSD